MDTIYVVRSSETQTTLYVQRYVLLLLLLAGRVAAARLLTRHVQYARCWLVSCKRPVG